MKMSDWFTVTAHALHVPAKSGPREIGKAGFPLFFPEPSFALRSGTNSYLHLPSWKQLVITAVYLPFGVLFRFSSTDRVFVMTLKSEGCRARALKSTIWLNFHRLL